MTLSEAVVLAESVAPSHLRDSHGVAVYEDAHRVIVAYRRKSEGDAHDLTVAVVDRATRRVDVLPFISVIDTLDGMRDLTA